MLSALVVALSSLLALGAAAPPSTNGGSSDVHIRTKHGPVVGHTITKPEGPIREFLGIPYAAAPIGPLRFAPPQSPRRWQTPLNATRFSPSCIQVAYTSPIFGSGSGISLPPPGSESEDCLTMNVWAPPAKDIPRGGTTVMLWTYGGGFMVGSSDTPLYNGGNWVARQKGVIVVSYNYRMNAFGFPGSPILERQNPGLLDVRKAVEWVRDNIAAFGGNPKKITLFGESAGGGAVDAYLYYQQRDPVIAGAIMQSGSIEIIWSREKTGQLDPLKNWNALVAAVNCSSPISNVSTTSSSLSASSLSAADRAQLTCMRRVPWSAIRAAISAKSLVFGPAIDNRTLYDDLLGRLSAGKFADVPVLIGSNDQETLGNTPEAITRTKEAFTCPAARGARGHAKEHPTWLYRYFGNFTTRAGAPPIGPYHGSEIIQVFGNFPQTPNEQQKKSSEYIQGAWTAFAKDPVAGLKKLRWPTFKEGSKSLVVLAKENSIEATFEDPAPYIEGC